MITTLLSKLKRMTLAGSMLLCLGTVAFAQLNPAIKPATRDANWMKRHQTFVDRAMKGGVDVLFVGDSITQGWEGSGKEVWEKEFKDWKPMNLGIGGDKTEHVLWRITEGKELVGIDPKVVVIMIGTNNTGRDSAEQIAEGVEAIIKVFKKEKPKAKILLLGVFPRSGVAGKEIKEDVVSAEQLSKKIPQVNEKIAKFADEKTVTYLDISKTFLNEKGGLEKKVMPDYLHLSKEGYSKWAAAIKEPVEKLVKN